MFLRFLRLLRTLFFLVAAVSIGGLMVSRSPHSVLRPGDLMLASCDLQPINIIYNLRHVPADARSGLTMLTVSAVRDDWLWGAVAGSYIFSQWDL